MFPTLDGKNTTDSEEFYWTLWRGNLAGRSVGCGLARRADGACRNLLGARAQPPDQSSADNQADGDQLGAGHDTTEDGAAARIVAQVFEEESGDTVDEEECAEDLAVKFSALQQPHQEEEIRKFHC